METTVGCLLLVLEVCLIAVFESEKVFPSHTSGKLTLRTVGRWEMTSPYILASLAKRVLRWKAMCEKL